MPDAITIALGRERPRHISAAGGRVVVGTEMYT